MHILFTILLKFEIFKSWTIGIASFMQSLCYAPRFWTVERETHKSKSQGIHTITNSGTNIKYNVLSSGIKLASSPGLDFNTRFILVWETGDECEITQG